MPRPASTHRHRPADWVRYPSSLVRASEVRRARREAREEALVLDPEGITMHRRDGDIAVAWNAVAEVIAWPDGEREVIGRDQSVLLVDPLAWRRGDRAVAAIDAAVEPTTTRAERRPPDPRLRPHTTGHGPLRWVLTSVGAIVLVGVLVAAVQAALDASIATSSRLWSAAGAIVLVAVAVQMVGSWRETRRLRRRLAGTDPDPSVRR